MKCRMILEFEFDDTACDGYSDNEWEAMSFVTNHLMDDDGDTPIKVEIDFNV